MSIADYRCDFEYDAASDYDVRPGTTSTSATTQKATTSTTGALATRIAAFASCVTSAAASRSGPDDGDGSWIVGILIGGLVLLLSAACFLGR